MMGARTRPTLTVCVLLTAVASTTAAQDIPSSFEQLRVLVGAGDTITVTDEAGQEVTGRIAELASSSLGLVVDGVRHNLREEEVRRISQRRQDSLANGALWGFAIGGALAAVGAASADLPAG